MTPSGKTPGFALVLSGGGARAAYQAGVLAAIAERAPDLRIPIVTGVSAGAINAAYLASHPGSLGDAARGLRAEWRGFTSDKIYGVRPTGIARKAGQWLLEVALRRRAHPFLERGLLDARPLRTLLARVIPFGGIEANIAAGRLHALALSATSYSSGYTVTFVDGAPSIPMWERCQRLARRSRITLDHVMASSAIPIIFPAVQLNGGFYGDGSVRLTSPLSSALHLGARKILAIGSGPSRSPPPDPCLDCVYPSAADSLSLLLDSAFIDALDADAERLTRTNALLAALPPGMPAPGGLRRVNLFVIRPSRDLGLLARDEMDRLPRTVDFLVRGMGERKAGGLGFLSYLLFEPKYTTRLVELGHSDAEELWPSLAKFLESE